MAAINVILFVAYVTVFYQGTEGFCRANYECPGEKLCCKKGRFYSECRFRCLSSLGTFCTKDSDCDYGFCCNNVCRKTCIGLSCSIKSQCGLNDYCCNYVCRHNCSDHACPFDSNCGGKLYCCGDKKCHDACIGHRCILDSDCGDESEYCCNDRCQKGRCGLSSWTIIMIVFGVVFAIGIPACVVLCNYLRRRQLQGSIVAASPVQVGITSMGHISNSNPLMLHLTPPQSTFSK